MTEDPAKRRTDELVERLYGRLRSLAETLMRKERRDHTLQPSALVHEFYLRVAGSDDLDVDDADVSKRVTRIMRRLLVEHARKKKSLKRGGDRKRKSLSEVGAGKDIAFADLIALDEALDGMEHLNPKWADVIELHEFGGFSCAEIAPVLGVEKRTVEKRLAAARAWLASQLADDG